MNIKHLQSRNNYDRFIYGETQNKTKISIHCLNRLSDTNWLKMRFDSPFVNISKLGVWSLTALDRTPYTAATQLHRTISIRLHSTPDDRENFILQFDHRLFFFFLSILSFRSFRSPCVCVLASCRLMSWPECSRPDCVFNVYRALSK